MKKIIKYTAAVILLAICNIYESNAQYINGVNLEELDTPYIFVNQVARIGRTINLSIDFGQEQRTMDMRSTGLLDRDGKALKFNTIVHGLNYLHQYGYILDETIVDPTGGATYILYKEF